MYVCMSVCMYVCNAILEIAWRCCVVYQPVRESFLGESFSSGSSRCESCHGYFPAAPEVLRPPADL